MVAPVKPKTARSRASAGAASKEDTMKLSRSRLYQRYRSEARRPKAQPGRGRVRGPANLFRTDLCTGTGLGDWVDKYRQSVLAVEGGLERHTHGLLSSSDSPPEWIWSSAQLRAG